MRVGGRRVIGHIDKINVTTCDVVVCRWYLPTRIQNKGKTLIMFFACGEVEVMEEDGMIVSNPRHEEERESVPLHSSIYGWEGDDVVVVDERRNESPS